MGDAARRIGGPSRRRVLGSLAAALVAPAARAGAGRAEPPLLGLAVGFNQYRWADRAELVREFADYERLGVRELRTDLYWAVVQEAGPASFDWSAFDRVLDLAEAHRIRLLPVCGSTPEWARSDPGTPSSPADPAAFADFLHRAVRRYSRRGLTNWEIWNEPNLAGFWPPRPDPARYAEILAAGSAAIRAADPAATVLLGGLAAVQTTGPLWGVRHHAATDFLQIVYDEAGSGSFDAVAFHPYTYPQLPTETDRGTGWGLMSGPIRDVMARNGDAAKPIWVTEYGAPTNLPAVTPDLQAEMLRRAYRIAAESDWIGAVYWYSYRDTGTDPDDNEHWFGMRDSDGTQKLSYGTFQDLAQGISQPD